MMGMRMGERGEKWEIGDEGQEREVIRVKAGR